MIVFAIALAIILVTPYLVCRALAKPYTPLQGRFLRIETDEPACHERAVRQSPRRR